MLQQIIALIVIAFFVTQLIGEKRKDRITKNEFVLWLCFWLFSALAVVFIKSLDSLARNLGFSANGINILIYATVLALLYFVFRLRLKLAKLDRDLSEIARAISLKRRD